MGESFPALICVDSTMKSPKFGLRTLLLLVAVLAVTSLWVGKYLRRQRAVKLLLKCESVFLRDYDPYLVVDAANELRMLSHSNAIAAMSQYEGVAHGGSFLSDVIVPLVFEATPNCPVDVKWHFSVGTRNSGEFELIDDLPLRIRLNRSWTMIYESPVEVARKWGKVRGGQLMPFPRKEILKDSAVTPVRPAVP